MVKRYSKGLRRRSKKLIERHVQNANQGEQWHAPRSIDDRQGITRIGWTNINNVPIMVGPTEQGGLPLDSAEKIARELQEYSRYSIQVGVEQHYYCQALHTIVYVSFKGEVTRPKLKATGQYGSASEPEQILNYKPPAELGFRGREGLTSQARFDFYDGVTILTGPEDQGGFPRSLAQRLSELDKIRQACHISMNRESNQHVYISSISSYVQIDTEGRVTLPKKYPDATHPHGSYYCRASRPSDIVNFREEL